MTFLQKLYDIFLTHKRALATSFDLFFGKGFIEVDIFFLPILKLVGPSKYLQTGPFMSVPLLSGSLPGVLIKPEKVLKSLKEA